MRAALIIAAKDLRERLRDRSAILIALVVPLVLAAIFSVTLSDVSGGDITFDYALVDRDGGDAARPFARDVLGELEGEGLVDLRRVGSVDEARRLVDDRSVAAAFVVPPGFSQSVAAGRPAELEVIGSVDAPIGTLVARSIAESYASGLDAVRIAVAAALSAGGSSADVEELARRAAAPERPVVLRDVSAERKELEPKTFYSAGMAVFFLFFTVQFGVSSLLAERRQGTLRRLLAAPIPRPAIVGGKLLTSFVLGVVSLAVLAAATSLLLGADWGDPAGVALLVVAGVLAATSVMALVATLARTPEQAGNWQAMIALVLGMLGGSFFPVSRAGGLIGTLSLATPHAWFLRGLEELSSGAGVASVLPSLAAMLGFAAVAGGLAYLRLGKLVEP